MKRLHVHVAVHDLERSVRFYSALFAAEPTVKKGDYAKWQLEDPRVNFAVSARSTATGIDHLGIQAENPTELEELGARFARAEVALAGQKNVTCCYARSDKYWARDPQGIPWEAFHTLEAAPLYGEDARPKAVEGRAACCAPTHNREW